MNEEDENNIKSNDFNQFPKDVPTGQIILGESDREKTREVLDQIEGTMGHVPMSGAQSSIYAGINHRNIGGIIPNEKINQGLVLFTRPNLNLRSQNLNLDPRAFESLMSTDPNSMGRMVRVILGHTSCSPNREYGDGLESNLFDKKQAFITPFTNTLLDSSGWPDIELPTYTTKEGMYKESMTWVDGIRAVNRSFDISCDFANLRGSPVLKIIDDWQKYMDIIYRAETGVRHLEHILSNRIDYQTRIFRILFDETKENILLLSSTYSAIPDGLSIGQYFNYSSDKPYSDLTRIPVRFKATGMEFNNTAIAIDFNRIVGMFNPEMRQVNTIMSNVKTPNDDSRALDFIEEQVKYVRIPTEKLLMFNGIGYPRINYVNWKMEFWLSIDAYVKRFKDLNLLEEL